MRIGIDASRAEKPVKTGVEWYARHVIDKMQTLPEAAKHEFVLYSQKTLPWPPKYLWTQIRLSWEMMLHAPDVLFVPAHVLPRIAPRKSVVTVHDVGFRRFPEAYKRVQVAYHEWSTKDIVKRDARIITVSEFCKREIVELYGAKPENIFVTPLGIDHGRYYPQASASIRNRPGAKPYILFIGRMDKKKNLVTLIRAFDLVASSHPDLELVLAGQAANGSDELRRTILATRYSNRIKMLGYVSEEEKPALLSNALMYVQPSIYEGFGLPPVEAMACGCPVIVSRAGSLPEVVGEGNGLFFDPSNAEELASCITKLATPGETRQDLIRRGLEWVQRYDWTHTARATLAVLESW